MYCTVLTAQEDNNSDNVWEVCDCCEKTTNFTNDPFYRCELVRRISWDFDKLQYHGWDDNTPIKPDVFDQLWDEGKEPDWDEVAKNMKVKMEDTG